MISHNTPLRWTLAAMLVAAALLPPDAGAGYCGQPDSTVCPCNCAAVIEVPDLGTIEMSFSGHMSLYCTRKGVTSDGREFADMISTDFEVQGSHPLLGNVRVHLDRSRFQELSNMTSLIAGQSFPARHEVLAHAHVTFSALPDTVWRSINSFRIRSDSVSSFDPAVDEHYKLVEPVLFEDVDNPGTIVGKMVSAEVVVGATSGYAKKGGARSEPTPPSD